MHCQDLFLVGHNATGNKVTLPQSHLNYLSSSCSWEVGVLKAGVNAAYALHDQAVTMTITCVHAQGAMESVSLDVSIPVPIVLSGAKHMARYITHVYGSEPRHTDQHNAYYVFSRNIATNRPLMFVRELNEYTLHFRSNAAHPMWYSNDSSDRMWTVTVHDSQNLTTFDTQTVRYGGIQWLSIPFQSPRCSSVVTLTMDNVDTITRTFAGTNEPLAVFPVTTDEEKRDELCNTYTFGDTVVYSPIKNRNRRDMSVTFEVESQGTSPLKISGAYIVLHIRPTCPS